MENCCLFYCHPLTHTIYVETFAQKEQKCCISNRIFFYSFRKNNYRGTVYYFNRFHKFSTYETQKKKHSKILISRIHELNSTNTNLRALNTDCQYTTSSSRNTRSHDRRRQSFTITLAIAVAAAMPRGKCLFSIFINVIFYLDDGVLLAVAAAVRIESLAMSYFKLEI